MFSLYNIQNENDTDGIKLQAWVIWDNSSLFIARCKNRNTKYFTFEYSVISFILIPFFTAIDICIMFRSSDLFCTPLQMDFFTKPPLHNYIHNSPTIFYVLKLEFDGIPCVDIYSARCLSPFVFTNAMYLECKYTTHQTEHEPTGDVQLRKHAYASVSFVNIGEFIY